MEQLVGLVLILLVVLTAFAVMFGGRRGLQKLFGCLLAPFSGCARVIVGGIALLLVLAVLGQILLHSLTSPRRPDPTPARTQTTTTPTTQTSEPAPLEARRFDYPVGEPNGDGRRKGDGWYVSQDFADTVNPYSQKLAGQHLGEDWLRRRGATAGQTVYAIADGKVLVAAPNKSYGHLVMIKHPLPAGSQPPYVISLYGHLSDACLVAQGTEVKRGDPLGQLGERGDNGMPKGSTSGDPLNKRSWPPHLHFELRRPVTSHADDWPAYGYSPDQDGFLNPTDTTSDGNVSGGGWIDAHR